MSKYQDTVDRLLAAPGALKRYGGKDATYIGAIARLFRVAAHLERQVGVLFDRHGLTQGEADVLGALYRESREIAPTAFAKSLMCSPGAMTNRIQNLERAGLIERRVDNTDRRAARLRLTKLGRTRIAAAIRDRISAQSRLLPGLDQAERIQLIGLLRKILLAYEQAKPENER